jgi:hypothetical protein
MSKTDGLRIYKRDKVSHRTKGRPSSTSPSSVCAGTARLEASVVENPVRGAARGGMQCALRDRRPERCRRRALPEGRRRRSQKIPRNPWRARNSRLFGRSSGRLSGHFRRAPRRRGAAIACPAFGGEPRPSHRVLPSLISCSARPRRLTTAVTQAAGRVGLVTNTPTRGQRLLRCHATWAPTRRVWRDELARDLKLGQTRCTDFGGSCPLAWCNSGASS